MSRGGWLATLALLGAAIAVGAVLDLGRAPPPPTRAGPAALAPYPSYVAGTGLTETGRGNIAVGTAVAGLVTALRVKVGDRVRAGDVLFQIDDRDLQARLMVARARVAEADAALARPRHRLQFLQRLQRQDNSAVSAQMLSDVRDDAAAAAAVLASAQAELDQTAVAIERCRVRAPAAGRVLQLNVRVGEYAAAGGQSPPLLLLGDDSRVFLRVDIDENDAWRVRPQAPARAYVRGNPALRADLHFEYVEPVVTTKLALTGQSTERTDVRVLQVIYSFPRGDWPVYLGQQMDVFIQAPPAPGDGSGPAR